MGSKPRKKPEPALPAWDIVDLGTYRAKFEMVRADGDPIPELRIAGGQLKRMRDGSMRLDLRVEFQDPKW
jgi:hypothetical protein